MAIEFRCPNCDKKLKTGDDKAGKTAKCPQCGTPVTVPAASVAVADEFGDFGGFPPLEDPAAGALPPRKRGAAGAAQVACPMCGAMNDPGASRCYACGEELAGVPGVPQGAVSLRYGDIWGAAWEKWSANLGISVAAVLIAFALIIVGYFVVAFGGVMVGAGFAAVMRGNDAAGIAALFGVVGLAYLGFVFFISYLQLGLTNFSLGLAQNREGNLGQMFPPVAKLPAMFVGLLVTWISGILLAVPGIGIQVVGQAVMQNNHGIGILIAIAGWVLQVVGQMAGGALFWPVPYLIADRTTGLFAAIVDGARLSSARLGLSFLLMATHLGLAIAGTLACFVGLLFSYSLSFVLFAVAYQRLKQSQPLGTA